jgi:hypothetical protein
MTQEDLKTQFHEETGFFYFKNHSDDEYIEWLENKLIQSQSKFHGYCKQETKSKGRCKEICDKPECGW